jgi:ATP-dependent helicase/nuclease subunit A
MTSWTTFTPEQLRASLLVDRGMVASAGAGSGKTSVMAVRYVACLLDRRDGAFTAPERIIAITFTREAAANLRVRIDATLRGVIKTKMFPQMTGDDGGVAVAPLDDLQLAHLRASLADLSTAPIETFDSFCLDLVGAHAAALGRDPDLRPADDLSWRQCAQETWGNLRADMARTRAQDYAGLIETYGEQAVKTHVVSLAGKAAALAGGEIRAQAGDPVEAILTLRAPQIAVAQEALGRAKLAATKETKKTLDAIPDLAPVQRAALIEWLRALNALRANNGPAKAAVLAIQEALDHPCPRRDGRVKGRRQSLSTLAEWDEAEERACLERAKLFAEMATRFNAIEREEAERRSCAGYARIEGEALDLLQLPRCRQWLKQRFRHALLDESQDFNGLQATFIDALRGEGILIFAVGDHRQSIYGFRHAAPDLFKAWEAALEDSGSVARMSHNFRSHPELVEQVKAIFAQNALSKAFEQDHITAGRENGSFTRPGKLALWLVDHGVPDLDPGCIEGSEAQAAQVAAVIARNHAEGYHYGEHAILLRGRDRMRNYAEALERAGIPYDADYPGGLYDSQECHDVEALLRLCLCESDRFALAVAVGGPWGTEDPHDKRLLVDYMEGRAPLQALYAATRLELVLPELRRRCSNEGVGSAVRWLAAQSDLTRRYGTLPLARRRIANLRLIADEESAVSSPLDIAAFIERLSERRRLGVDAREATGTSLGNKGVRLMTIHGAKGLEWPVVIVPDTDRTFNQRDENAKVLARPIRAAGKEWLGVACAPRKDSDFISLRHRFLQDEQKKQTQAEQARLFYVACTRASEQLHLMASSQAQAVVAGEDARSFAQWLSGSGHAWDVVAVKAQAAAVVAAGGMVEVRNQAAKLDQAETLPDLPRPIARTKSIRTVTELLHGAHQATPAETAAGSPFDSRGSLREIGIALHEALARHGCGMSQAEAQAALDPFCSDPRHAQYLKILGDRQLVPGYWDFHTRLIEQPVLCELKSGDKSRIVSGACDLVTRDQAGHWRIYDYKSGGAARQETSAAQVQCYAHMLRPHLDGELVEGWLVDLEGGPMIAVDISPETSEKAWKDLAKQWV